MPTDRLLVALLASTLLSLTPGCARYDTDDPAGPCDGIACSGHGTCVVVEGRGRCECDDLFMPSEDGERCVPVDDPCLGVSCSGHGACTLAADGGARCVCDEGYEPRPEDPLVCVAIDCTRAGDACTDATQCCQHFCHYEIGASEGYCSLMGCADDDECVQAAGGSRMCCVDFGGGDSACVKIGPGCDCGQQTGTCGDSCHCTWHSDCAPGLICLGAMPDDPNALCTRPCTHPSDCSACTDPGFPDGLFDCTPIVGGDTYCMRYACCPCGSSADCPGDEVCFPEPDPGGNLVGACGTLGGKPTGAECDESINPDELPVEERCAGYYCLDGRCSAVCQEDFDCPEHMECDPLLFCLEEPCDDPENQAEIHMCQWMTCCP